MTDLVAIAHQLMAPGKGILAADESNASADEKRLAPYGIAPGADMRRQFRDLLLATPGLEQYLTGVILFEETLDQKSDTGTPFPELLRTQGIMPGIKVDTGLEPLTDDTAAEEVTKGLLGLGERLARYHNEHGTAFTKWRAVIRIDGDRLPTTRAIAENAKRLAAYACEVQRAGMVPMIEPEVLLDGPHSRVRARAVIEQTMTAVFAELEEQCADIRSILIKTSMALSGNTSGRVDTPGEVAEDTIAALMGTVPAEVAGIVFLSGGQTPDQATANLAAIVRRAREMRVPWPVTFSYARAIQEDALAIWKGEAANVPAAREAYLARLHALQSALMQ